MVCCTSFAVRTGRDGTSLAGRLRFVSELSGEYVVAFVGMLARAGELVTLSRCHAGRALIISQTLRPFSFLFLWTL